MDPPTNAPVFRAILLTDIAGHSDIRNRIGEERFRTLKQRHDEIIRQAVHTHEGRMENDTGDGWVLSFTTPSAAVRAALEIQHRLRLEPENPVRLGVRMGIDMGEVRYSTIEAGTAGGRLLIDGVAIGNATMTMNLAEAGQILVTQPVFEQAHRSVLTHPPCPPATTVPDLRWKTHGTFHLKGWGAAVLHEVGAVGLAPFRPPIGGPRAEGNRVSGAPGWLLVRRLASWEDGDLWLARNTTGESQIFRFAETEEGKQVLLRQLEVRKLLNERLETAPPAYRRACLPILDSNFQTWPAFLRMEYIPDGNLRQALSPGGAFASASRDERVDFVRRVADILDQVSSQGRVAHGCLETSKILVTRNETGAPRPCLYGFSCDLTPKEGPAASGDLSRAKPAPAFRDRRFCPPEGLRGGDPEPAWDVYSLGVVLLQVATGRWEQLPTAAEKHVQDPLLREEIFACLDDDPEKRPPARQLALRLQTLPHRRDAARYRRWVQRFTLWLSLLTMLSVSVLWFAWRERQLSEELAEALSLSEIARADTAEALSLSEIARADTLFRRGGERITANRLLDDIDEHLRSPDWQGLRALMPPVLEYAQPKRVETHGHVGGRRWAFIPNSKTANSDHPQVYLTEHGFRTHGAETSAGEVKLPFPGDACCYDPARGVLWVAGDVSAGDSSGPALAAFSGGPPWTPIQLDAPALSVGYPRMLEVSPDGGTLFGLWVADQKASLETFRIVGGENGSPLVLERTIQRTDVHQPFYPGVDVHWGRLRDFAVVLDSRDKDLAVGDEVLAVRLLDLRSGEEWAQDSELARFPVQSSEFRALQISPDGEELLLAHLGSPVSRWETASGARIGDAFPLLPIVQPGAAETPGTDAAVNRAAYHPGFPRTPLVAVARYEPDHRIEMWSIAPGAARLEWAEATDRWIVGHLRFSPSGKHVVAGSVGGFYRVWNSANGNPVVDGTLPGKLSIQEPEFTADDALISFSGEEYLQRWTLPAPHRRALAYSVNLQSKAPKSSMYAAAFSPDSSELFVGLTSGSIARFNLRTLKPAGELSGQHAAHIRACTLSTDGSVLLTSCNDYKSTIWTRDADGGGFTPVDTLTQALADQRGGQDLRTGRFFLAEGAGKLIKIFTPFPVQDILPDSPPGAAIFDLPEGDAPLSERLRWDRLGPVARDLPGFATQLELNAALDPAGNWLATAFHSPPSGSDAGSALALTSLRDDITWFVPGFSLGADHGGVLNPALAPRWDFSEVSFSADGRRVLAASNRLSVNPERSRFTAYICDLDEMRSRWPDGGYTESAETWATCLEPGVRTTHVQLGPLGKLALTAGEDGIVRVWDVSKGSQRTSPRIVLDPRLEKELVRKARFAPGREDLVATLSEAQAGPPSCRLWALPQNLPDEAPLVLQREIIHVPLQSASNPDLQFSPDGRWLLLCGWRNHFRLVEMLEPDDAQTALDLVASASNLAGAKTKKLRAGDWEASLSSDRRSFVLEGPSVARAGKEILLQSPVRQLAHNHAKNLLLIVTEDGRASLWNPRFGVETIVLAEQDCIAARFHPESGRLQLLRQQLLRGQPHNRISEFNPAPPFGFVERWELLETALAPE